MNVKSIVKTILWLILIGSTLTFWFHFLFGVILIGMKEWESFPDFLIYVLFEHHDRAWWQLSFLVSILSIGFLILIQKKPYKK
jgi:thiamine transporter ThiT